MPQIRIKSFASRAQLAVTQAEIDKAVELEWDRRLITVLGAANNRLYEFRLQTANSTYEKSKVNSMVLLKHSFLNVAKLPMLCLRATHVVDCKHHAT